MKLAPVGQREAFDQVCKQTDATIAKIAAGEKPTGLCGCCYCRSVRLLLLNDGGSLYHLVIDQLCW